ncbi:MAG: class I SAM-dependent DNA methyltransferase [Blastocatellia bacterium]
MAKARDERHRYGQHYTPNEVARLLAAFAVRAAGDLVFDPACGDGRLLAQAITVKQSFAARRPSAQSQREVFGTEVSAGALALARETGAQVALADFFDVEPGAFLNESVRLPVAFDAVIGNPPYIRQEVMGAHDKRRIMDRLASDRRNASDVSWPRWSGRSDIYVYFFARAVRFLRAGGRLVFLTASSWLDAGYGAALREFLLNNFRVIAVIESAAESFFGDASVNTSITVLEREPDAEQRAAGIVRFVQLIEPLSEILNTKRDAIAATTAFAQFVEQTDAAETIAAYRLRLVTQAALMEAGKATEVATGWGKYLRADDIFFRILGRGGARLLPLSELAQVRFGVKTGANDFFYLQNPRRPAVARQTANGKKQTANGALLALDRIARVQRGLTTGANEFFYLKPVRPPNGLNGTLIEVESAAGTRHQLEARFLAPVVFSLKEISSIWLERAEMPRLFFNCPLNRDELRDTQALAYIRSGERAGYHLRPTCAARDRWYAVTRQRQPAPLILPSKVGERWLVAINRAGVFEDKKLYGIYPRRGVSMLLIAALLNSTWARYYAEVTCRQMTGAQAIADIDVAIAERLLIPDPYALSSSLKRRLESALMRLAHRPVLSIFDEAQRQDRRRLDELTLEAIGFRDRAERRATLGELYTAVTRLVRARIGKQRLEAGG